MIVTQFLHSFVHINSNLGNTYLFIKKQNKKSLTSNEYSFVRICVILITRLSYTYINNLHYYQIHTTNIGGMFNVDRF